jgi:hypothetical protein
MTDVLELHKKVMSQFRDDLSRIPTLERTLSELRRIDVDKINPIAAKKVELNICELEEELLSIQYAYNYNFYLLEITPLLDEYRRYLNKPMRVSFMGVPIKDNNDEKDALTERILFVISKYTAGNKNSPDIQGRREIQCRNCKQSLHSHIAYHSKMICPYCGNEEEHNQYVSGYKDNERVSIVSKYSYNRRIHFKDCMYQFQGKQKSMIPDDVIDLLTDQCVQLGLVHDNSALSKPQRFSRVTWHHIFMLLKDNSLSNYYEDVYLIYHKVTGKKLHDISHLEDRLINDFDILSELYDKIYINDKNFNRKNFISMQYVLFQLLKRYNYPCCKDDFNFIKTVERQFFHDYVCSNLFKRLNWNHTSIF